MTRQTMFQAKKESQPLQTSSLFRRQAAQAPVEEREAAALPVNLGRDFSGIPFKPVHPAPALGPSSISCPFTPQRCPFGGACHACPPKMQAKLKIGQPGDRYEQEADRVAEQVMRMPEPQVQRKCSAPGCKDEDDEKKLLQTKSAGSAGNAQVDHPLIQSVLSSPGQPLDAGTRSFMEPRFGQDFSGVRVHTDGQAAESARTVNARAYTVGRDVVFGEGQYAPGSDEGKRLVAHELTHTLQQTGTRTAIRGFFDECSGIRGKQAASDRIAVGDTICAHEQYRTGVIQRKDTNQLDEKANKIIKAAKDSSIGIDKRAIDAVNSIVKVYYDAALVDKVIYDEKDPGLTTTPIGTGKDIKGQITVGKYFIENISSFARRVLQVGHELQHVQQQRAGMGGPTKKNEREFLAFHWEATQPKKAGIGKMPHATRVALIDEALRNYYCMPDEDQKTHVNKKEELLKLREPEEKASGREHAEPPKECERKAAPSKDDEKRKSTEKEVITQPQPQKIPASQVKKEGEDKTGVELSASIGVETETKREEGETNIEVAGKFSFEAEIPITDKLEIGPVSLLKGASTEASAGLKSGEAGPLTSLELEATVKAISLDSEKVKVPLGIADFGIRGSALAGAEYTPREKTGAAKFGFAGEAEAKFKRSERSPFFITVKGGVEKTYDKEGAVDFKWSPLKWKTGAAVGVEF